MVYDLNLIKIYLSCIFIRFVSIIINLTFSRRTTIVDIIDGLISRICCKYLLLHLSTKKNLIFFSRKISIQNLT